MTSRGYDRVFGKKSKPTLILFTDDIQDKTKAANLVFKKVAESDKSNTIIYAQTNFKEEKFSTLTE